MPSNLPIVAGRDGLLQSTAAIDAAAGLGKQRLQLRRDRLAGPEPQGELHGGFPIALVQQIVEPVAPQTHVGDRRNLVQRSTGQLEQVVAQPADFRVGQGQQIAIERRFERLGKILLVKQQLVAGSGLDVPIPKPRVGGQGAQGRVDQQGGKVIQARKDQCLLIARRMLIRRQPDLGIGPAHQAGHGHAVVIDQANPPVGRNHDVAVLQVAMHNARGSQCERHLEPVLGRGGQGGRVPGERAVAGPVEQRCPFDPIHRHQRIQLAVRGRADAAVVVLEPD